MTGRPTDPDHVADAAPDVPGVVVGWRAWLVHDPQRPRLRSPLQVSTEWPAGTALHARCELGGDHPAPDPACTCGVYAARDPSGVSGVGFGRVTVIGCVALWGTVVEGEKGWRAGVARPVVLFSGPGLREPARTALAAAYGVAVHPLRCPVADVVRAPGITTAAARVRAAAAGSPPDAGVLDAAARAVVDVATPPHERDIRTGDRYESHVRGGRDRPDAARERHARDGAGRRFTVGTALLAAVAASVLLLPPPDTAPPPSAEPLPWAGVSPR